jgi:hypothetical protein
MVSVTTWNPTQEGDGLAAHSLLCSLNVMNRCSTFDHRKGAHWWASHTSPNYSPANNSKVQTG